VLDERNLVAKAVAGNRRAFERLIRQCQDDVYRFLFRMTGSDHDLTDDLLQETCIAAFEAISKFRGESLFRTWMIGIATNIYRQSLRKKSVNDRQHQLLCGLRSENDSNKEVESGRREKTIQIAFRALAQGQREALYLREILGCSCAETAVILGISESSVKNRVYHGRIRLRQILESMENHGRARYVPDGCG
jgi:RNA polymerase sigma-70 factor (ECF subfamily)